MFKVWGGLTGCFGKLKRDDWVGVGQGLISMSTPMLDSFCISSTGWV